MMQQHGTPKGETLFFIPNLSDCTGCHFEESSLLLDDEKSLGRSK